MEQAGESRIAQPRDRVWRALNDPEVLSRCLDGCKSMTRVGDGEYEAEVGAKVGPVKATFKAAISLNDVVEPESYRLDVEVKGGAAGFAKGSALVNLEEVAGDDGDETLLTYQINGNIGGKLAQIGSRLVDAAARKMAARFFERIKVDFDTA
ncbi:MAG: carbon monoxide dehydrogenase subunit G [Gammaproteobacteria bacterium]|nr:carbon monoxide dehydrogenase subunit G [Gammaproteobacteria bacterium]MDE0191459.1 carbon monoxide dehydrogenase subunit G [Gammaproteobacteria bacterium]